MQHKTERLNKHRHYQVGMQHTDNSIKMISSNARNINRSQTPFEYPSDYFTSIVPSDMPSMWPSDMPSIVPSDVPSSRPNQAGVVSPTLRPADADGLSNDNFQSRNQSVSPSSATLIGTSGAIIVACILIIVWLHQSARRMVLSKRYQHHDNEDGSFGSLHHDGADGDEALAWYDHNTVSSISSHQSEFPILSQSPAQFVEEWLNAIETPLALHSRSPPSIQRSVSFCLPDEGRPDIDTMSPARTEKSVSFSLPDGDETYCDSLPSAPNLWEIESHEIHSCESGSNLAIIEKSGSDNSIREKCQCELSLCTSSCSSRCLAHGLDEGIVLGEPQSMNANAHLYPIEVVQDEDYSINCRVKQWKKQGKA
mmetsp:Transcript_42675/g.102916  ORF Transcript_42675/g.102916 Transcript_42675/m.102916 type:complete len:367 (-) Transcript_42675:1354-2454(-)